jgi:Na+/melibiose symporter-like transporter
MRREVERPAQVKGLQTTKEHFMSLGTILLIVLILILIGVIPVWPHARSWGYAPGGIVGVILVIVIVLFLLGRL